MVRVSAQACSSSPELPLATGMLANFANNVNCVLTILKSRILNSLFDELKVSEAIIHITWLFNFFSSEHNIITLPYDEASDFCKAFRHIGLFNGSISG